MAKQFTLGKNERLKSRKLIEQLFKKGKCFNAFPFRVYYIEETKIVNEPKVQFGCGVSTKNFKKAVDRNRIKRLTREGWRLQKHVLIESLNAKKEMHLSVFFIYTPKELPEYKTIYSKTGLILSKLIKLVNEADSPNT